MAIWISWNISGPTKVKVLTLLPAGDEVPIFFRFGAAIVVKVTPLQLMMSSVREVFKNPSHGNFSFSGGVGGTPLFRCC